MTFRASFFFNVGQLVGPSSSVAHIAFAVEPRPETQILVKINDSLQPGVVKVKVGLTLTDPEA